MPDQFPDINQLIESLLLSRAFRDQNLFLLVLAVRNRTNGKTNSLWGIDDEKFRDQQATQLLWQRIEDLALNTYDDVCDSQGIDPEAKIMARVCRNKLVKAGFDGLAIGCAYRMITTTGATGKKIFSQILVPFVAWCPAQHNFSQGLISKLTMEIMELAEGYGNKIECIEDYLGFGQTLKLVGRVSSLRDLSTLPQN